MRGEWKLVESYSGDIDYWVEETTVRESSNSMDKATASQYSVSASASFEFMGVGGSVSASAAQQNYLRQQFSNYQYNSRTTRQQRTCIAPSNGHSAQIW